MTLPELPLTFWEATTPAPGWDAAALASCWCPDPPELSDLLAD